MHGPAAKDPLPTGANAAPAAGVKTGSGFGSLAVNVRWPGQASRYSAQTIPVRTDRTVITLKNEAGEYPKDQDGRTIEPIILSAGQQSEFNGQPITFPEQASMSLLAEVFDDDVDSLTPIGSASRVVDIVPGLHSYVGLDVVVPSAPHLDEPETPQSVSVGTAFTLTGQRFGFTQGWAANAEIELTWEATLPSYFGSQTYMGWSSIPLTAPAIKIESDEAVVVTIPEAVTVPDFYGQRPIMEALSGYFSFPESKLFARLVVDGVNSNRVEIAMPKTGGLSAGVELKPGAEAPARALNPVLSLDLKQDPHKVSEVPGAQWTYRVSDSNVTCVTIETVKLKDAFGSAERSSLPEKEGCSSGHTYSTSLWGPYASPYEDFTFLYRLTATGSIQPLDDEFVLDSPGPADVKAKHYFYNYIHPYQGPVAREIWIKPEIGPVLVRDTSLSRSYSNPNEIYRRVKEFRLTAFTQGTPPTPAPLPTPPAPPPYDVTAS